jgi:predicted nucleic acid-binding protein
LRELEHPRTPDVVRAWLRRRPEWVAGREAYVAPGLELEELDAGERNAIQLAINEDADLLLMDERAGVAIARQRGLIATGTQGVLLQASHRGLVDSNAALAALQATAFRSTRELIEDIRRREQTQHQS